MSEETSYEVGYRRPPKHSQFKKGQSGNPRNRQAKKSPSFADFIDMAFARQVTIREEGKPKNKTLIEVITRKLVDSAAQGNAEALDLLMLLNDYSKKRQGSSGIIIRIVDTDTGAFIRDEFPQ
jgi:hypothetical protein